MESVNQSIWVVIMAKIGIVITFFTPFKWFFLGAMVVISADLIFGIKAAKARKEVIRPSRAVRRTFNKITDYFTWIILAIALGEAFGSPFGIPLLPGAVLVVIFGSELNSIFANYFEYKGQKLHINVFNYIFKKSDGLIDVKEGGEDESKNN